MTRRNRMSVGHESILIQRPWFSARWNLRAIIIGALLATATITMTCLALTTGDANVDLGQVWAALTNAPDAGFARTIIIEWRLPRALAAVIFGAALGASGAVFQSVTRNPLASPDVIGFTTGSYTGALLIITSIGGSYLAIAGGALIGGIATATIVYLLAWRGGVQGFRLIVIGIAISAILGSLNTWMILTADLGAAINAAVWGTGTLDRVAWDHVALGAAVICVLLVSLGPLLPSLRQMELGDDIAQATGVRVELVRLIVVILGVALIATVTAAAGPIAFVALAAPQISRRLVRSAGIAIVSATLTGAFLLVTADYAAQHLLPTPLPVGVITVIIGGGYLIWLLIHETRRRR